MEIADGVMYIREKGYFWITDFFFHLRRTSRLYNLRCIAVSTQPGEGVTVLGGRRQVSGTRGSFWQEMEDVEPRKNLIVVLLLGPGITGSSRRSLVCLLLHPTIITTSWDTS